MSWFKYRNVWFKIFGFLPTSYKILKQNSFNSAFWKPLRLRKRSQRTKYWEWFPLSALGGSSSIELDVTFLRCLHICCLEVYLNAPMMPIASRVVPLVKLIMIKGFWCLSRCYYCSRALRERWILVEGKKSYCIQHLKRNGILFEISSEGEFILYKTDLTVIPECFRIPVYQTCTTIRWMWLFP